MIKPAYSPNGSIRLGAIAFVNTIPVYYNFQPQPDTTLVYQVPARLNDMIRAQQLEISPVSSACYLRHQDELVLLEDLSVSSPGAVESVLFLSKDPLGPHWSALSKPDSIIYVPNDSETSVMLLAYLLQQITGQDLRPRFKVYDAAHYKETLAEGGNALIIGDNALMMKESMRQGSADYSTHTISSPIAASDFTDYSCYDLSSLWREKTGLPFVFAVWVANKNWVEANPYRLVAINQALRQARDTFFADAAIYQAGIALAQTRSGLPPETLKRYYDQCLDYALNNEHRASLQQFAEILKHFDQREVSHSGR